MLLLKYSHCIKNSSVYGYKYLQPTSNSYTPQVWPMNATRMYMYSMFSSRETATVTTESAIDRTWSSIHVWLHVIGTYLHRSLTTFFVESAVLHCPKALLKHKMTTIITVRKLIPRSNYMYTKTVKQWTYRKNFISQANMSSSITRKMTEAKKGAGAAVISTWRTFIRWSAVGRGGVGLVVARGQQHVDEQPQGQQSHRFILMLSHVQMLKISVQDSRFQNWKKISLH